MGHKMIVDRLRGYRLQL